MRVGYTIISLSPQSQATEFAEFLKSTLILEEGIASNIAKVVANGDTVNIYTFSDIGEGLKGNSEYNFKTEYEEIIVDEGTYLVASAVDFRLEIRFQGSLKVLKPTEYFVTTKELAVTLHKEISQGLLRVFPEIREEDYPTWILEGHRWNDAGIWMDEKSWND